ncbi:MAG: WD40 repeat domain-containing serine/threonine protein kinase [Planctomycetota bacterium]
MGDLDRLAHAVQLFLDFQSNPRPRDAWLLANRDYRDLLEPMLAGLETHAPPLSQLDSLAPIRTHGHNTPVPIRRSSTTGALESLGAYRILSVLGEGGMGTVYLAEQLEPIRRQVALKVVRLGMETGDMLARFEAERQALARMDHPNIARVLEAGNTSDRCPYFVMEYVVGDRITRYCDNERLTLRKRVELFARVCDGVQHAHQNGIIHRDLKPSNLLVCSIDGVPTPKIIDFGIAKAFGESSSDAPLETQTGRVVGTPPYMSPEQLDPDARGIDTRTDIYSLGVLLHELLVGRLPFDAPRSGSGAVAEFCRMVQEQEPARPSSRIHLLGDAAIAGAAERRENLRSWSRQLEGELDWIVLRCLEKDRARRYASASDLAADLRRHLADEPVLARPPSNIYRLQKLVRKNRGFVTASCIVLLSLAGGLGWSLFEMRRADLKARELARQVYRANLQVAADAIALGRPQTAMPALREAPVELRGWEWRHFESLLDKTVRRYDEPRGTVVDLSVSADGQTFVTAAKERTILHRRVDTGSVLRTIPTRGVPFQCAISKNGDVVIAIGAVDDVYEGRVWVAAWRLSDGKSLTEFVLDPEFTVWDTLPQFPHDRVVIDADLARIYIGHLARLLVLDVMNASIVASRECSYSATGLQLSPSKRSLLVDAHEPEIPPRLEILDAATLKSLGRLTGHRDGVTYAAFSPDEARLGTVTMDGRMQGWDLTSASLLQPGRPLFDRDSGQGQLNFVLATHDGTRLITSGNDRTICFWDSVLGTPLFRFPGQETDIAKIALVPGKDEVMSVNAAGSVQYWSAMRSDPRVLRGHRSFVYAAEIDHETGLILSAGWDGWADEPGGMRLWDLDSGDPVVDWGDRGSVYLHAMFLPGQLAVLELGTTGPTIAHATAPRVRAAELIISSVDLTTGSRRELYKTEDHHIASLHVGASGTKAWFVTIDGNLQLFEVNSGNVALLGCFPSLDKTDNRAYRIVATPDEGLLAIASGITSFRILRARDLAVVRELPVHARPVSSLDFDAAGRRLLSASEDGTVRVWDVERGEEIARLVGHDVGVLCAKFNPSGDRIATAGRDKTVRIWSGLTYEQLAVLTGHEQYVYLVDWQADGERLVSASGDMTVRIWETQPARHREDAHRMRQEVVERLTPRVDAWLATSQADSIARFFESAADLGPRERQVARQIFLSRRLGVARD